MDKFTAEPIASFEPMCALCKKPVDEFSWMFVAFRNRRFIAKCHGRWEDKIITSEELKQNAQEMLDEWFQADRDALNAKLEQNAIEYEYVTFTSNTTNVPAAAGQERQLQSEPKLEPKPSIVTLEPKKRMITLEE